MTLTEATRIQDQIRTRLAGRGRNAVGRLRAGIDLGHAASTIDPRHDDAERELGPVARPVDDAR